MRKSNWCKAKVFSSDLKKPGIYFAILHFAKNVNINSLPYLTQVKSEKGKTLIEFC